MRNRLLSACLMLSFIASGAEAGERRVSLTVEHGEVTVFHVPQGRIAEVARSELGSDLKQGDLALGFTLATVRTSWTPSGRYVESDGSVEIGVTGIDITMAGQGYEVYVPAEFPPGSCGYNFVLDHEMEHVQFNMEAVEVVEKALPAAVAKRLDAEGWRVTGASKADADDALKDAVSKVVDAVISETSALADERHRSIDERDRGKVIQACPDRETWIAARKMGVVR